MQKIILIAIALSTAAACQTADGRKSHATARAAEVHSKGTVTKAPLPLTLYFETDAVTLDEPSMNALNEWGEFLRTHPKARLTIAGHADERGTTEYNIGLGETRAYTAKKYLVTLGAREAQIDVKTFGEERPAVAGFGEDAWQKNRRDELAISFN